MPQYRAPLDDFRFLYNEFLDLESLSDLPTMAEVSPDLIESILDEAARITQEVLQPLNEVGDRVGCRHDDADHSVTMPEGFREAYQQFCEAGWSGLVADPNYGGQGLPTFIGLAVSEMKNAANPSFAAYPGLTLGAYEVIHAYGSEEQKQTYLPKMISGEWAGTMNLTEPQCGTDLGLIKTKAIPQGDGSYKITGQKIWISGGEQDITENIIHLVLARIEGAPEGIKGISLFVVPKFIVGEDGSLGDRNEATCGGLEEKMGIHGNATCVMNYDGATGWLVGEEHKGMRTMFVMMNEARLGVGLQGYAQGEVAYQNALGFALDRLQGRDVTGVQAPDKPADPIIVHPDVRRNLMDQKAFLEGARAFTFWGASMIDASHRKGDEDAEQMVSLLTPVIKGFLTDKGFETTVLAQQTLGGSGFTREWGLEQFVRDARIPMIYEGTNGVQALDLVGRKLPSDGGKGMMAVFDMLKGYIKENAGQDAEFDAQFLDPLKAASKNLQAAGTYFMQHGMKSPNNALSGSYDFMHLFGHVCLGLMWAKMAKASKAALAGGASDTAFHETKIATGRHYMARHLPMTATHLARIEAGGDTVMALAPEHFASAGG